MKTSCILKIRVESNIPVPPQTHGPESAYVEVLGKMRCGQSFRVDSDGQRKTVIMGASRHGFTVQTRKVVGEGFRVWLISKPRILKRKTKGKQ